jgi:hypothetical protein
LRAINEKLVRRMTLGVLIFCASPGVLPSSASAEERRSSAVGREFQLENPCPSTGQTSGACPGYVKDHIVPLACGAPDDPANLQWQTIPEAKAKDKWEREGCAPGNGTTHGPGTGYGEGGIVTSGGTGPRAATHPGGATYNQPGGIVITGGGR